MVVFLISTTIYAQSPQNYLLGDVNRDGRVTVADVMMVVDIIMKGYTPFSVSSTAVSMPVGGTATIDIEGGYNEYEVTSSNTDVVTASLKGSTITLTAVASGDANVTVKDVMTMRLLEIPVTVEENYPQPYLTCPDEHHPHMIALGLPSGTFWACCNVDTNHPENQSPTNYGGYYAWAETETKSQYNDDTYLYFNRGDYKYFGNISGTQYDVAHVKWGDSWQMPTSAQLNELFINCTYEWSTVNDVNGYKFYGPNGGCIFLPAAGYGYYGSIRDRGYDGHYWASGQFAICNSTNLYFTPYDVYTSFAYSFEKGFSVRPVATLQLSSTGFALNVGSQQTVSITSGSGSYNAESSDTNVASVKINGETLSACLRARSGLAAMLTPMPQSKARPTMAGITPGARRRRSRLMTGPPTPTATAHGILAMTSVAISLVRNLMWLM